MRKKLSVVKRMLAFVLTFAMAFTAISWGDVGEVMADETTTNLIKNGGFEEFWSDGYWPKEWTCENVGSIFKSSEDAYREGSYSLNFRDASAKELWITQEVTIAETGTYEFSAWAKGNAKIALAIGSSGKQNETSIDASNFGEIKSDFELTAGSHYVSVVATTEADGWGYIDSVSLTKKVTTEPAPSDDKTETITVYERNFSGTNENLDEWQVNPELGTNKIDANCWKLWNADAIVATLTTIVTGLSEGTYYLSVTPEGGSMTKNASTIQINNGEAKTLTINEWGKGVENKTDALELTSEGNITIKINLSFDDGGWLNFNNIKLVKKVTPEEKYTFTWEKLQKLITAAENKQETEYTAKSWSGFSSKLAAAKALVEGTATIDQVETAYAELTNAQNALEAPIWVKKVDGLSENFIRGVDISSYVSITHSGATFKDFDGNVLSDEGFFKLLKDSGVNYVRIKIWNDPYDEDRNGYGGGNSDLAKAKILGKLATDQGMGVLINFHYSDFWADPERQYAPKAWKNYTIDEKETALYNFTKESLQALKDAGVKVTMVQVGNETNNGIAGETKDEAGWDNMCKLFSAGCKAVKDFDSTILRAVHFTDPQTIGNYDTIATQLKEHNVDYDVFATSYYPNIHGSMENITAVLKNIVENYGKKVMVAETDWAWTTQDGDGHGNSFSAGNDPDYSVSVQGEANEIRDVIEAVKNVGEDALGVFVWEPAWIPVQNVNNSDGTVDSEKVESNKTAWETYGSGWASSFSAEYDPEHGGAYYGGSVKDNNGFFDFDGNPLEVLTIFKDVYTGKTGSTPQVDVVKQGKIDVKAGNVESAIAKAKEAIPATVVARLTNGEKADIPVVWASDTLWSKIVDFGIYEMSGTATYTDDNSKPHEYSVKCTVSVMADSILENGGFESGKEKWTVNNTSEAELKWNDTPKEGSGALHFYDGGDVEFQVSQEVKITKAGNYRAYMYLQGGAGSDDDEIYIEVKNKNTNQYMRDYVSLKGWNVWQKALTDTVVFEAGQVAEITISASCIPGAWGSFDEVYFYDNESPVEHAHSYTLVEAKAAGCMEDGNEEHYICKRCGSLFSDELGTPTTKEDVIIPAKGSHDLTLHEAVAPTYSAAGNKKYYECNNCHKYFEDDQAKKEIEDKTSIVIDKLVYTGSGSGSGSSSTPDSSADNKNDSTTTKNPDGTTTETKTETTTNESGKEVETTVTTKKDADGKVTGSTEVSTIAGAAKDTAVTVTVEKDAKGNVAEAAAEVTKKGTETEEGTKGTISAAVVQQIKEAAGSANVAITTSVTGADGKEKYSVTVSADDLVAGAKLTVVVKDAKTGKAVLVDAKQVKVTAKGNVSVVLPEGKDYTLIDAKEATKVTKEILKTVVPAKTSATLKAGKANTAKLSKKLDMDNVKKITYTTSKKGVVTVNKNGKVVAKKAGTATITIKVTLNNGKTKTVKMKYTVK